MQIALDLGIDTVGTFTFAWPGEYSAGKPTWPMRWLTRGGYIANVDLDKLVMAFSLVMEEAECIEIAKNESTGVEKGQEKSREH
jgi:hypothetical protein